MSTAPDPQSWVFPPQGAARQPSQASAAFGPITKGDRIKLLWAPADQQPEIHMICANDGRTFTVSDGSNASGFIYTFNQTLNDGVSHVCWIFFPGTSLGNTVTFDYANAGRGSSVLWQQNSQVAAAFGNSGNAAGGGVGSGGDTTTTTTTVTVTADSGSGSGSGADTASAQISTITQTFTIIPGDSSTSTSSYTTTVSDQSTTYTSTGASVLPVSAASTDVPSSSQVSAVSSPGLSPGAAAGIAIAGMVVLAALCLLGFCAYRRGRRDKSEVGAAVAGAGAGPSAGAGAAGGAASTGGPVHVPTEHKYIPPQMQQAQGYYAPVQPSGGAANMPRRTVHEIEA